MKKFYVMLNDGGYIEVYAQSVAEAMTIFKIHYKHLDIFAVMTQKAFEKQCEKSEEGLFRIAVIRNSFNKVQAVKYMAKGYGVGIRGKDIYYMNNFGDIYSSCHKAVDYNNLEFDADYYIPEQNVKKKRSAKH